MTGKKKAHWKPKSLKASFAYKNPQLAMEWDCARNDGKSPEDFTPSSIWVAWWICPAGRHPSYEMAINKRKQGAGCPKCKAEQEQAKSLATLSPEIASEFHREKNGTLRPEIVPNSSNKKFWWTCPKNADHDYEMAAQSRTRNGSGCPYCAGKRVNHTNNLSTCAPEIAAQWHPTKNKRSAESIYWRSTKKFWFLCAYGHESHQQLNTRTVLGVGCPECRGAQSRTEKRLLAEFEKLGIEVVARENIDGREVDLWLPDQNIGIEADGAYYHGNSESKTRDQIKNEHFNARGITLLRVREKPLRRISPNDIIIPKGEIRLTHVKSLLMKLADLRSELAEMAREYAKQDEFKNPERYLELVSFRVDPDNSLARTHPEIAKDWDYHKNAPLTPLTVTYGQKDKVSWLCETHGAYMATINKRTSRKGTGCPVCAGQKVLPSKSVAQVYPELCEIFASSNQFSFEEVAPTSGKSAWWRCIPHGHLYERIVRDQVRSLKRKGCVEDIHCPHCQTLACRHPELKHFWDHEKNAKISLHWERITFQSNKKAFWLCEHGHSFERVVSSYLKASGCKECKNRRRRR